MSIDDKVSGFMGKVRNMGFTAAAYTAMGLGAIGAALGLSGEAKAEMITPDNMPKLEAASGIDDSDFGKIYKEFNLGGVTGYDTAGGNNPDENYFRTNQGIQVRDREGNLTESIILPYSGFGLASDGEKIFVNDINGTEIYYYPSYNDEWSNAIGLNKSTEAGSFAGGLAASEDKLFQIYDNGIIDVFDKINGDLITSYDVSSVVYDQGQGLGYSELSNTLIFGFGSSEIGTAELEEDQSAIKSIQIIPTSGLGSQAIIGTGVCKDDLYSEHLVINNDETIGQYATGVHIVPEPGAGALLVLGLGTLGAGLFSRNRKDDKYQGPNRAA